MMSMAAKLCLEPIRRAGSSLKKERDHESDHLYRWFLGKHAAGEGQKLEDEIFDTIDLLPHIAIMGSTNLPDSIATRYGANVRKLPIKPFDVIYEITDDKDFVVLGMIHQRSAK